MAGFLQKFIRGGATAGAGLYADRAREEMRARIVAERDAVLNQNAQDLQRQRQEFNTSQHKETMAQRESEFVRSGGASRGVAADQAVSAEESKVALEAEYANAKTDIERKEIAKRLAFSKGQPTENYVAKGGSGATAAQKEARQLASLPEFGGDEAKALKFLKSKDGSLVRTFYKTMAESQESLMVDPESEEYMSPVDMWKDAVQQAKEATADNSSGDGSGGGGSPAPSPKDTKRPKVTLKMREDAPRVSTQEEANAVPSGSLFFNTTTSSYEWAN